MGVILQVALPSRVLAAARLQCGAAGAGASRGLGVCAEHARLAARGESPRDMEIDDFLVGLGPGRNSQCAWCSSCPGARWSRLRGSAARRCTSSTPGYGLASSRTPASSQKLGAGRQRRQWASLVGRRVTQGHRRLSAR